MYLYSTATKETKREVSQIMILLDVQLKESMSWEKWAGSAMFQISATNISTEKLTRQNPHKYLHTTYMNGKRGR
jgi:hypothetical protein